jgi:tetratricopeptide (TPR) repeat protein
MLTPAERAMTLARVIVRFAAVTSLLVLVGGCVVPPVKSPVKVRPADLPEKMAELIRSADEIYVKSTATVDGGSAEMEIALVALEKAVALDPKSYEAAWKAARACAWLADDWWDDKTKRAYFSATGREYAKAAIAAKANGVEGYYYGGINNGAQATTRIVSGKFMVPSIRDAWKRAMQIDAAFDHGGPPRVLGSLYAQAPPWPASIGDPEKGVKLLQQAVELGPDYPQNALLLGDALMADERYEDARQQYRNVLDAKPRPDDAHFLMGWKKRAAKGIERAECKLRGAC